MTNDVEEALATLQLHPDDSRALERSGGASPRQRRGHRRGGAVGGALRRPPLSPRARRLRAVRPAHRSRARLDDGGRAAGRSAPREGAAAVRRAAARRGWRGLRQAGAGGVARARAVDRVGGADGARAGELGADLAALPAAGGGRQGPGARLEPLRLGRRVPPQVPPVGPGEGEAHLRKSLELDPRNRRSGSHLERLLRESGRTDELLDATRRGPTGPRTATSAPSPRWPPASCASGRIARTRRSPTSARRSRRTRPSRARSAPCAARSPRHEAWTELGKVLEAAARTRRGEQDVTLAERASAR